MHADGNGMRSADSTICRARVDVFVLLRGNGPIGTASANSAKFHGIKPRMYIEDLLDKADDNLPLTLYNVLLMSQKPW